MCLVRSSLFILHNAVISLQCHMTNGILVPSWQCKCDEIQKLFRGLLLYTHNFYFHVSFLYDFCHSLIFGLCWPFWGLFGIFLGFSEVRKLVWGLIINTRNSTVLSLLLFCLLSFIWFWSRQGSFGSRRVFLGSEWGSKTVLGSIHVY